MLIKDATYNFVLRCYHSLFAMAGCPGGNEPCAKVKPAIRNLLKFFNDILTNLFAQYYQC